MVLTKYRNTDLDMFHRHLNKSADTEQDEQQTEPFFLKMRNKTNLPSASDLLESDGPPKSGYCMKKNNSYLAYFFPCLFKKWKRRFFILCGNFLFRFSSEHGESPKGVPIPLESCTVKLLRDVPNAFELSTIRKTYVIQANSQVDCNAWVEAIKSRKAQAIRENMGHAPVSENVRWANMAGNKLFSDRLKRDGEALSHSSGAAFNPMAMMPGPHS